MYRYPLIASSIPFSPLPAAAALCSSVPALLRRSPALLHCPAPPPTSPTLLSWRRAQRTTMAAVAGHEDESEDDDLFTVELDPEEYADESNEGSPWEGALVYRRNAAVHHVEYATTLERLGLGDLSSTDSRARAAAMGILSSSSSSTHKETPVLVSLDVTRRRGRLRLDGILRTVIALTCFRCADPAPQGIFANFSLLLTEDPVEEPDVVDLGTIYGEEEGGGGPSSTTGAEDDGDDHDIDWDDRLHFPAGAREIDISKNIRDTIHLEITFDAVCSPTCKGFCLACGENLNTSTCNCTTTSRDKKPQGAKPRGPMKDLLKQMQQR